MEWQPIETAPLDGTRVLVLAVPNEVKGAPNKVKVAYFQTVPEGAFMAPGFWRFEGAEALSYENGGWMPLPSPPSASKEGSE